jgi:hypothetical protein
LGGTHIVNSNQKGISEGFVLACFGFAAALALITQFSNPRHDNSLLFFHRLLQFYYLYIELNQNAGSDPLP